MILDTTEDRVLSVLSTEYHVDFLPDQGPLWGKRPLKLVTSQVASFIRVHLGREGASSAAQCLLAMAADREGPMIEELTRGSHVDWACDPQWPELQEILRATAQALIEE